MLAVFTGKADVSEGDFARFARFASCAGLKRVVFSRQSRNLLLPNHDLETSHLYYPIPRETFSTIIVDATLVLHSGGFFEDFFARLSAGLTNQGAMWVAESLLDAEGDGCGFSRSRLVSVLGEPVDARHGYLRFGPFRASHRPRSVLGMFYEHRATLALNNVTGASLFGSDPTMIRAMFAPILYPGDPIRSAPQRLKRSALDEIVRGTRDGRLDADNAFPTEVPPEPRGAWDWDSYSGKLETYLRSWQSYLIPGAGYKSATLAHIIHGHFGGRQGLSFLEHGGNAGLLSAQLLLDLGSALESATCCEVDLVPLVNALFVHDYFRSELNGRFFVRNRSAEEMDYDRKFSIIAYIHSLVYMRRDMIPNFLGASWEALEPGGMLVVFDNTIPPSGRTGVDAEIIFTRDEIDGYLSRFGSVEYFSVVRAERMDREATQTAQAFRVVRKPRS